MKMKAILSTLPYGGPVNGSLVVGESLSSYGRAPINRGCEASESVVSPEGMFSESKHIVKFFAVEFDKGALVARFLLESLSRLPDSKLLSLI